MHSYAQKWAGQKGFKRTSLNYGFTIIELLIVIIVIAILATLVITAYNGVQTKAADAKHKADQTEIYQAILAARENTGETLAQITGSTCTSCACFDYTPSTEPKDQPKSSACWTDYYSALSTIGEAAGVNLDGLKAGDTRGNPSFYLNENEAQNSPTECDYPDSIGWYSGDGTQVTAYKDIPFFTHQCQTA